MNKPLLSASGVLLVLGFNIAGDSPVTTHLNQDQNTNRQTEKQFINPKDHLPELPLISLIHPNNTNSVNLAHTHAPGRVQTARYQLNGNSDGRQVESVLVCGAGRCRRFF